MRIKKFSFRLKTKENRGAIGNKTKQAWKYTPKKEMKIDI